MEQVVTLKVHKQRYFYHFMLEGLVRLAPLADLLASDTSIMLSGFWSIQKHPEVMAAFRLTPDRFVHMFWYSFVTESAAGRGSLFLLFVDASCWYE
jgi:hypothetical protein